MHLIDFGKRCRVDDPRARIQTLIGAVEHELGAQRDLLAQAPVVNAGLHAAFEGFASRF